jgi:hypothetical protein
VKDRGSGEEGLEQRKKYTNINPWMNGVWRKQDKWQSQHKI